MKETPRTHWKRVPAVAASLLMLFFAACTAQDLEKILADIQSGQTSGGTSAAPAGTAGEPVIEQFEANPPGAMAGDTITLRWRTRNADRVSISRIGEVPPTGQQAVDPGGSYVLTATGGGRSVSQERFTSVYQPKIIDEAPVIETFEANPPQVTQGGTTTLRWRTRNAESVTISGIGAVPPSGSRQVTVGSQGTYVLTATGRDGRSVSQPRSVGMVALKKDGPVLVPISPPPRLQTGSPTVRGHRVDRPAQPMRVLTLQSLPAPALQAPANGQRFDHFPRKTTLQWKAVPGAASYTVEIDCYGCCRAGRWCTDVGRNHKRVPSVRATAYTFNFVGAQPGRWRVWAVDRNGREGNKSGWRTFRYTR